MSQLWMKLAGWDDRGKIKVFWISHIWWYDAYWSFFMGESTFNFLQKCFHLFICFCVCYINLLRLDGLKVSMSASHVVGCGFAPGLVIPKKRTMADLRVPRESSYVPWPLVNRPSPRSQPRYDLLPLSVRTFVRVHSPLSPSLPPLQLLKLLKLLLSLT